MRDLDFISSLGVPVYTRPGYGGGVYLDENYKFDQSFFTPQEVGDLVLALHIADCLSLCNHKNPILKKLELLLPELTLAKERDFYEYVKVDPLLQDFDLNDPVIQNINRALDDEVWLKITYENHFFEIVPLYYAIGANGISLCGSDGQKKLLFPIQQITSCSTTTLEFDREQFQKYL